MKLITCETQRWEVEQEIKAGEFEGCILKSSTYHRMITWTLVVNEVPFHRVNYGAGVITLLPNTNVCPNCSGKGVTK